jgi:hypothetical protein
MARVIVVGGGAAGCIAALSAAQSGADTILLEQNEKLGKKLFITGKGRCNLTNAADMRTIQEQVVSNGRFLYSAFRAYSNRDVMQCIENNGCPLKVERGGRVFPVSDHSSDVIAALERALRKAGVRICLHAAVKELLCEDGETRRITGVCLADGSVLKAERVIVATGGLSYPSTGSTGEGHRMLRQWGHCVTELYPSLTPLVLREQPIAASLMGLSLKHVAIRILDEKKERFSSFGEMLFTHFGVSGPVILSASAVIGPQLKKKNLRLEIDMKPALSEEQLDQRLLRDFFGQQNRNLSNALSDLFPARLIPEVIRQSGVEPDRKIRDMTREERGRMVQASKHLSYTVTGLRGFQEAIITKGGIDVKEVNPSTMESKRVPGLYLAGELLDLDAMTGGFNLQIAWSTGYLAGMHAALD